MAAHLARTALRRLATSQLLRNQTDFVRIVRPLSTSVKTSMQQKRNLAAKAKVLAEEDMFCFQCEQTKNRTGCVTIGVCGKTAEVAHLQDLLCYILRGVAMYGHRATKVGAMIDAEVYDHVFSSLFSTLTNVNFDHDRFPIYIKQTLEYRDQMKKLYEKMCKEKDIKPEVFGEGPANYIPPAFDVETLDAEGRKVNYKEEDEIFGKDVNGVRQMIVFGLKGMASYARHAVLLGKGCREIAEFTFEALDFLETAPDEERMNLSKNLEMALGVGKANLKGMELLDKGHSDRFGVPSPHEVSTTPVPGKAILVSGHDVGDLLEILEATEGTGINVYTHGELLPGHGYPEVRKHKHLVGNYGGAWYIQKYEFPHFPGPIVVTTNCLVEPMKSYKDRLFTVGDVGWSGCTHLDLHKKEDMEMLLESARNTPGFTAEQCKPTGEEKTMAVGFGHDVIASKAEQVIEAVQQGSLKRIFVVGGCDGPENRRSYYTKLVDGLPDDTIVLTMGCAKYRFNRQELGTLGDTGIPRLLDLGQCNDAYGAVAVASALADAMKTDVNSLPLSLAVSWFEQKAVAVLLTLLHLGIKNIRLGPKMPAFITPNVMNILVEKFNLQPSDNRYPLRDMEKMLGETAAAQQAL